VCTVGDGAIRDHVLEAWVELREASVILAPEVQLTGAMKPERDGWV
jgi:hypothetical protein